MEVKKTYEIIRNGITILLCVGDEPLETDTITNSFNILVASDGKTLFKDGVDVGGCVCLGETKESDYEEQDIIEEEQQEVEDE